MAESKNTKFLGTYFNPDAILRLARWADILAWTVAAVYAVDFLLALYGIASTYFMGGYIGWRLIDFANNLIFTLERPFRGVVYFIALQAIGRTLLILMDMEENTRRAARK